MCATKDACVESEWGGHTTGASATEVVHAASFSRADENPPIAVSDLFGSVDGENTSGAGDGASG